MSELTRRGFVTKSAGAAAGLTAIGGLVSEEGFAAEADAATPDATAGSNKVLAFVSDRRKGEITVMTSNGERTFRNRKLAAQLARDAR